MALERGKKLGNFEIERLLGRGGMGEVYDARDLRLGRHVALKLLPEQLLADPERIARFRQEARVLASLNHPRVAAVYDYQEDEGQSFLVMELVPGVSLRDYLERNGPMEWPAARPVLLDIARGLEAAHEQGIVHRDLKPGNVHLTPKGEAKILDFGLATRTGSLLLEQDSVSTLSIDARTAEGRIVGTMGYMSPEQLRGQSVGPESDIFSFACIAYELLSGAPAFAGPTPLDRATAILHLPVDLSHLSHEISEGTVKLLAHCFEKDTRRRLGQVGEICRHLESDDPSSSRLATLEHELPDPRPHGTITLVHCEPCEAEGSAEIGSLVEEVLTSAGGFDCNTTGDSGLFAFQRAEDAARIAIELQEQLRRDFGSGRIRIGLHTGTPARTSNGYVGIDVRRAMAIASSGRPGEVRASSSCADLLSAQPGLRVGLAGELGLPGRIRKEPVFRLSATEPSLSGTRTSISSDHPLSQDFEIIGRDREIKQLEELLDAGHRLVTLIGAGGSGKTVLARCIGQRRQSLHADGTVFVDLSAVSAPDLVPIAIATACGLVLDGAASALQGLTDRLIASEALLLLDNFEHLLEAAPVVDDILARCPDVTVLVTSRRALRIRGEHELPLSPLAVPAEDEFDRDRLENNPAVQLFLREARVVDPNMQADEQTLRDIAELTRRLDGLPLALELAAAKARVMRPRALIRRLEQRPDLLQRRQLSATGHQSLRASIRWSFDGLDPRSQHALCRLSVFRGGFTLDSVTQVLGLDLDASLDALEELLDHSLIRRDGASGEDRYTMMQTIREYARDQLSEAETEELDRAHAAWMQRVAEESAAKLSGSQQQEVLQALSRELDNLRAALDWARRSPGGSTVGLLLASDLTTFWWHRHLAEGRKWLNTMLERPETQDHPARPWALWRAGFLANYAGVSEEALTYFEQIINDPEVPDESALAFALCSRAKVTSARGDAHSSAQDAARGVEISRSLDRPWLLAICLGDQGGVAFANNDLELVESAQTECRDILGSAGATWLLAAPIARLGDLALRRGKLALAEDLLERSAELWRSAGSGAGTAQAVAGLAMVLAARGNVERARDLARESLILAQQLGSQGEYCFGLAASAMVLADGGRQRRACQLFSAAVSLGRDAAHNLQTVLDHELAPSVSKATDAIDPELVNEWFLHGSYLSSDEALRLALEGADAG